ncbi:lysosomal cobalamin transporter ABCD4-like [Corticium candelabrum]|uniref:lysosomal cobalamin transporter ABCD4-like n=1 Tax=Corticium candelabrum TaxID=121492 RepID=UPI002E275946|nr:lysosomal cobalamin transporter ABCD4-like [Corticium candelabrum]
MEHVGLINAADLSSPRRYPVRRRSNGKSRLGFDRLFLKRLWRILRVMMPGWLKTTTLLLIVLLLLAVGEQFAIYYTGLVPSQFYGVLTRKDANGFKTVLWKGAICITAAAMGRSFIQFVCGWLHVMWRKYLTDHLHDSYCTDIVYYNVNVLDPTLDNIDQRITQDVERFTFKLSDKVASKLIITPFTVIYYTYKCWNSIGYFGPVLIYLYFFVGVVINKLIMSPIVHLVYKQENLEGDFRFQHMQLRVHSESVAFYRSGELEKQRLSLKFKDLLSTQGLLVMWNFLLNSSVNIFDYVGGILSYLIIALAVFGTARFDSLSASDMSVLISENSFFCLYLINQFSSLIDLSNDLSDIAGYTHRIGQLMECLHDNHNDQHDLPWQAASETVSHVTDANTKGLCLQNVSYCPPSSDQLLVNDLTIELCVGKNILVSGRTGVGKSSLFRVISNIWPVVKGKIQWQIPYSTHFVFFLPQRAFLVQGSVREQVAYPRSPADVCDEKIKDALSMVDLSHIVDEIHFDKQPAVNWDDILSPGEVQKLGFARLFCHQPRYALLDEATSAVDEETEGKLYDMCQDLGITLVSISHRMSLKRYHHVELCLTGGGEWTLASMQ